MTAKGHIAAAADAGYFLYFSVGQCFSDLTLLVGRQEEHPAFKN